MLEIGRMHTLQVDQVDAHGAWLRGDGETVLLPHREVSAELKSGDRLSVFVSREAGGSLLAIPAAW
jgi:predicted RNA-binding protein (virulence factor B family)